MAKSKKKKSGASDLLESSDVLREKFSKTEEYFEKHKNVVFSIVGIIIVIVVGFFLFRYYVHSQNHKAEVDMFQAIYYYEADSLDKALNGDGNNYGFLDIIDNYSLTKSADLAHFYAGSIYLKKGNYDDAISELSKFNAKDIAVQPRAYSLIGDAYMEKNDPNKAVTYYKKAAEYMPNEFLSPEYLEKEAAAYEKLTDYTAAGDCYNEIITKYYGSSQYQNAKKEKARLDALAKK